VHINGVAMAEARLFYRAIDFLATRRTQFTFEGIISGTYTLDRATEALRKMAAFSGGQTADSTKGVQLMRQ
jgi:hypothetical protein